MKVESSIKENYSSTTVEPITNTEQIIPIICEWNGISVADFKRIVWDYRIAWTYTDWTPIFMIGSSVIDPIGMYLMAVYNEKDVVFEKWDDKFFWTLRVRSEQTKYALGDKVIDIPFRIRAENDDTGEKIVIFPKASDIVQKRMRGLYVVNPGWAERQRIEKEIMAKLIELAQVKGWNEIISTQNVIEDLQKTLKKSGIELKLSNECILLTFPRRKVRDVAWNDREYRAPPIEVNIDFVNRVVQSRGYSSHWFGTPSSWWNPCWWNRDTDIYNHLQNCEIKELINLIISWAYGYNSRDTWLSHDGRHPLGKLREYLWYIYDHRESEETKTKIEELKEHLTEIKEDLNVDFWLEWASGIRDFISSLECNETAE